MKYYTPDTLVDPEDDVDIPVSVIHVSSFDMIPKYHQIMC